MSTLREGILATVFTTLGTALGTAGTVWRSREGALARNETVAVIVHPDTEAVEFLASQAAKRGLVISVTVIARGDIADQVADPVVQQMHAALMADETLGGRCARIIEQSTKWDFEVADKNAVAVEVKYLFLYLTPANSLASLV